MSLTKRSRARSLLRLACCCSAVLLLVTAMPHTVVHGQIPVPDVNDPGPGLVQYWYEGNSDNFDQVLDWVESGDPIVEPFRPTHGNDWWFGHQFDEGQLVDLFDMCDPDDLSLEVPGFGPCVRYPEPIGYELNDDSVLPVEGNGSHNNYTVVSKGFLRVPESGAYQFTDGIDDYTYWAIDTDKSGAAGDSPDEILIDDDNWTDIDRDRGTREIPAEVNLVVEAGGEWLAVEFAMGEGGGHDAGMIYWDYDVHGGGGLGGFADAILDEPLDQTLIPLMAIPQSHLYGGGTPPTGGGETVVITEGVDTFVAQSAQNGPDGTHGDLPEIEFDGEDGGGENHALIMFDIPDGVLAGFGQGTATLTMQVTNEGDSGMLHRMTSDWLSGADGGDSVTWNNIPDGPGVVAGGNAAADSNAETGAGTAGQAVNIDVSADVQAWANGEPNYGWGILPTGNNGYGIASFENGAGPIPSLTLVSAGGAFLQAGDSNQDFEFNQLDLVQVQIAAKYLTGDPATWGEGDWNGAPGGTQGSPPPGDGQFNQLDIIAALNGGTYLTGPYNALAGDGTEGDGQTSIIYNPGTGEVAVDAPAGVELTSVNIDSAGSIFTGEGALNLGGSFDNDADNNIFKATFGSSFGSLSFGNVAQTGLSKEAVLADLTVIGSLAGGGDLGAVDLIYVPEPSTLALTVLALAGVIAFHLRRRRA